MGKTWQEPSAAPGRSWLVPGDPFRLLVDTVRDYAIFMLDEGGVIQTWNAGAELITGYRPEEIIGRPLSLLYTREEAERGWAQRSLQAASQFGRFEDVGWRLRKDGQRFWADVVTTAIHGPDGVLCGYSEILRDLTERKAQEEAMKRSVERSRQLWTQAIKDPLTGAFNRRYMVEQLRGAIQRASWVTATLLLFDIDYFKTINDRYGHASGDAVLLGVAGLARRLSRDSDLLFRLGGDEFVLYLPGVGRAGAMAIAERLRIAVGHADLVKGSPVSVSIGVAELRPNDDPDAWLQRADAALYEAKRGGRNRVA